MIYRKSGTETRHAPARHAGKPVPKHRNGSFAPQKRLNGNAERAFRTCGKARSARRKKQYQSVERHKPLYINTLTRLSENRAYAATHAPVREKTALARLTLLPDE